MKKRLMAITFAALMATSMMGSTVFAATDGGSVAGKTSLADADFDTDYQPQKDEYKIYCTYKNIHSWYDAIKTGVDAAVADLKDKGVTIDYEWYGPAQPDAVDQVNSIETAVGQGYDLIAVDVNQADTTAKAIDTAILVKNGPSYSALGFGGEGFCTFTIASRTGEGLTSASTFTKRRRCVMTDSLCIR